MLGRNWAILLEAEFKNRLNTDQRWSISLLAKAMDRLIWDLPKSHVECFVLKLFEV